MFPHVNLMRGHNIRVAYQSMSGSILY